MRPPTSVRSRPIPAGQVGGGFARPSRGAASARPAAISNPTGSPARLERYGGSLEPGHFDRVYAVEMTTNGQSVKDSPSRAGTTDNAGESWSAAIASTASSARN